MSSVAQILFEELGFSVILSSLSVYLRVRKVNFTTLCAICSLGALFRSLAK